MQENELELPETSVEQVRGGRPPLCVLREGAQKDLGHHLAFPHPVARCDLRVRARNALVFPCGALCML